MTDPEFADATYIEPITAEYIEKIIEIERPDAILATLGGQTALNAAIALNDRGTLTKFNVILPQLIVARIANCFGQLWKKLVVNRLSQLFATPSMRF